MAQITAQEMTQAVDVIAMKKSKTYRMSLILTRRHTLLEPTLNVM